MRLLRSAKWSLSLWFPDEPDDPMTLTQDPAQDLAAHAYRDDRVRYWDEHARLTAHREGLARYYHRRLAEVYRFLIPPAARVLEIGSGRGDLLGAVQASYGVGVDFSPENIAQA